jgi:hypothetical protein
MCDASAPILENMQVLICTKYDYNFRVLIQTLSYNGD